MHFFSHVLHLSIILSSIAFCFHYIHAFLWTPFAPLIIFDHFYVSRVKFYSFLYPFSIMTKRGRKCGFFLKLYMLGGEIYAFVWGDVFHLARGSVYLLVVLGASFSFLGHVTIFTYIVLIFDIYMMYVFLHLSLNVFFFFLSLYICFFMYAILISVAHMIP